MKRLILKKLTIISQAEHKAKIIEFDPKLTVIVSENNNGESLNRTGKSFVMKSIYHAMGAKLKQYTTTWKQMNVCTIIEFYLDDEIFVLYRNIDKFILMNGEVLFKKFESVSELKEFYVEFFNFNMKLTDNKNKTMHLFPGAVFMPFYIDQDRGWTGEWNSFGDIYQASWKKEILQFHLGVKPNKYYELIDEQAEISNKNQENKTKQRLLQEFYDEQLKRSCEYLDINVQIDEFADEIINLTNELNCQLNKKNAIKAALVSSFNRMTEIDELYEIAKRNLCELVEDIEFINTDISDEQIICPTCGSIHENSISNRFLMFNEVEDCNKLIDAYFTERKAIEKTIDENERKLMTLSDFIETINDILNRNRDEVRFEDVIRSEGAKTVLSDMKTDIGKLNNKILLNEGRLSQIIAEKTKITKNGNAILKQYYSNLKSNLVSLDVNDIDPSSIKKFEVSLKCGGNDTPCAIISQIYALYDVAYKNSNSVISPIVLDAIFQQEPAKPKIQIIWDFIINKQPINSQLIVSTTEMHGNTINGKVIPLLEERGLLNDSDFIESERMLNQFKGILLN